jgi:hypothetical protein
VTRDLPIDLLNLYTQLQIATIVRPLFRAKADLNPYEWAVFFVPAGPFVLSMHSPGNGDPEARLRSAYRILRRNAVKSVAASLWQWTPLAMGSSKDPVYSSYGDHLRGTTQSIRRVST